MGIMSEKDKKFTPKDLAIYKQLDKKFEQAASEVSRILSNSKQRHDSECNISYASEFSIYENEVLWAGEEFWGYGGYEAHNGSFPIDYLFMTEEELMRIVEKENQEYEINQKNQELHNKKKRYDEYLKLKDEFENKTENNENNGRYLVLQGDMAWNITSTDDINEAKSIVSEFNNQLTADGWDDNEEYWILDSETDCSIPLDDDDWEKI